MRQKQQNMWASVARYTELTITLPAAAFVGYAIGYGLDQWFSTGFLRVVFLILGVAAGLIQVVRGLTREQ